MATRTRNTIDQSVSISATAVSLEDLGFTASQVRGSRGLAVTVDNPVRYLTAGTPTASFGHYIPANETTHFTGGSAGDLRFIAVSSAGAGVITLDTFDTP